MTQQPSISLKRRLKYPFQRLIFGGTLMLRPQTEWALFHLGNAHAASRRPQEAIALWQRAADRPQPRPAALRNLASTLMQQGSAAEAIVPLRRLVDGGHATGETYALLGLAYQRAQQLDEAIRAYARALAANPDNDAVRLSLGVLYERTRQPQRALDSYQAINDPALRARAEERSAGLNKRRQRCAEPSPGQWSDTPR